MTALEHRAQAGPRDVAPTTLSQSIARTLASDIIAGGLASGDRLDESSIARRFKVSRTPVRDALRQLVSTRLIEHVPRRGFSVARVDRDKLRDLYEGLSEIEALCAALCALRARATQRGALELVHARAKAAAASRDPTAYAAVNDDFHAAIYAGAHNATLKTIALDIRQRLAAFRSNRFFQRDRIKTSLREHEEILKAIFAQDPERAASAMRLHTTRTAINVMNQLAAEADVQHVEMSTGKRKAASNARRSTMPKMCSAR
jgi:DNA-binding GntR family transcriptional regulator